MPKHPLEKLGQGGIVMNTMAAVLNMRPRLSPTVTITFIKRTYHWVETNGACKTNQSVKIVDHGFESLFQLEIFGWELCNPCGDRIAQWTMFSLLAQ